MGKHYDNYSEGAVNVDLRADRSTGEKNIEGTIYFIQDGEEKPITFKSSYSVVNKPNAAIVSADKIESSIQRDFKSYSVALQECQIKILELHQVDMKASLKIGILQENTILFQALKERKSFKHFCNTK